MAGSQLKRLKASLRDQGIIGPQTSKKQKRKNAQDERGRNEKRLQRGVVLSGIREQFNPFDLKHAKGPKFQVTSNAPPTGSAKSIQGRPGQAKAASEEKRRNTLLIDMQRRNKVGGILDRRFGENDPTMAVEDKMLERFAMEKQRSHKKSSMFDLEEDDGSLDGFTHGGKSLTFDGEDGPIDDFDEDDLDSGAESDGSIRSKQRIKRLRALADSGDVDDAEDGQPERKKTKKEVMEEIIAKSKMHKYERQAAKEDDTDMRELLDKELPNIQMLLASSRNGSKRADEAVPSSIAGVDRDAFDKNFDLQVKKLAQDKRAQPADRTKTEEEIIEEESKKLKELEEKRQKRMRGEEVSDSDEDSEDDKKKPGKREESDEEDDEEEAFGLGTGIKTRPTATELGFDDEDDFVIEDDLVASGSDLELADSDEESQEDSDDEDESDAEVEEEEDDEFTKGLLNEEESRNPIFTATATKAADIERGDDDGLPFTFPCPESVEELLEITTKYPHQHTPKIVQRIRALYHPKLDSKNKEKLSNFASALVDYVASPWDPESSAPFFVIESIVRHIHSLAKMFPVEIGKQFRHHIEEMEQERPLALTPSDLVLLSAVASIFPTSDHFHQVVTPAMLSIGRYLGQRVPQNLGHYATGTYLSILSLQYQQISKRYVPEAMNFTLNSLSSLAPVPTTQLLGQFPVHKPPTGCRIEKASSVKLRKLRFEDCLADTDKKQQQALQAAILNTSLQVIDAAADLWTGKEAFIETFEQALEVVHHLNGKACRSHLPASLLESSAKLEAKLNRMLRLSQMSRRPLELHHHRPLAIKTFVPKFEDTFDPDKHYDPDRERAELAKLKKEHKRERKGAMRELRKDANFMAREKLRVKKAKDEAYEKKFKRLVAEIQSEEGKEANAYEREKDARKRAKNR